MPARLLILPSEVTDLICSYLNPEDLSNLYKTTRQLQGCVERAVTGLRLRLTPGNATVQAIHQLKSSLATVPGQVRFMKLAITSKCSDKPQHITPAVIRTALRCLGTRCRAVKVLSLEVSYLLCEWRAVHEVGMLAMHVIGVLCPGLTLDPPCLWRVPG
jgi:hypothetical protein